MRKLTTEEFIAKARAIHGDKYDYSKVVYINAKTKVCIICPEHGEFWQLPNNHLQYRGCSACGQAKNIKRLRDKAKGLRAHSNVLFKSDGSVHIPLPNSGYFIVDAEDYSEVSLHRWRQLKSGYIVANIGGKNITYLHRYLMKAPKGKVVDHINHDKRDNRKSNLRVCLPRENMLNRVSNRGVSQYKGVSWHPKNKSWVSEIRKNGIKYHLGSFKSEEEAARAYDEAAKKYHKDFARLNFPE